MPSSWETQHDHDIAVADTMSYMEAMGHQEHLGSDASLLPTSSVTLDAKSYLQAVDMQQQLGTDSSTATGCSSRASLGTTTSAGRTRLSSKAKPFVSGTQAGSLNAQAKPFISGASSGSSFIYSGGVQQVAVAWDAKHWQSVVMPTEDCSPQTYSEAAQEDVYVNQAWVEDAIQEDVYLRTPYSEPLQEDVYLAKQSRGRMAAREAPAIESGSRPWQNDRIPSRTPSPSSAARFLAVDSWLSIAAEMIVGDSAVIGGADEQTVRETNKLKQPPVKRTFIHYDHFEPYASEGTSGYSSDFAESGQSKRLVRSSSSPSIMLSDTFHTIGPTMLELHSRGDCSPCAYFYAKQDGCRRGSDCNFCHLCPADAMKKRKKQRSIALKQHKAQHYPDMRQGLQKYELGWDVSQHYPDLRWIL